LKCVTPTKSSESAVESAEPGGSVTALQGASGYAPRLMA
jgi:hypothetical protein